MRFTGPSLTDCLCFQIIDNLKHLLAGEEMDFMDPFYRGFEGTIEQDAKSNQMGSSHDAARPDTYTLPSAPYPRPEIIDISAMPGATQRSDRSNQS